MLNCKDRPSARLPPKVGSQKGECLIHISPTLSRKKSAVDMRLLDLKRCVGRCWGRVHRHEKLPRSKKCQLSLNELCVTVKVAPLGPSFGTAGNWIPYKSNVVTLSAALDIWCMTTPYPYLSPAVKSRGETIKIILKSFPARSN